MNFQDQRRGEVEKTEIPQFATVTDINESGLQLIFNGEQYPTKKRYKYNTALTFKVGDRVRVNKQSGSYIVEYPIGTTKFTTPPDGPSSVKFSYTENSVSINWSDPSDKTSGDDVIAKWAGTYLVRNESRIPLDETDGTVLVNNKVKDAYKTIPFVDTGLIAGKTYYYNLFTYSDSDKVNRDCAGFSVTPEKLFKYGIRIDIKNSDPDTAVEYLYDAVGKRPAKVNLQTGEFDYGDWADVGFVKDCKPCMLRYDGTVDYYLNPNDYSKKEDGTPSDISDATYPANAMVEFPLWYLTQYYDSESGYEYIIISEESIDSRSRAHAFMREDGTIADKMYLSMFVAGESGERAIASLDKVVPKSYLNSDWAYLPQKSIGSSYFWSSFSERDYVSALLMIMAKSLNLQESFGYGPSTPYQINNTVSAQFFGMKQSANRTMNVFHLKNWWGDPYILGGIGYDSGADNTGKVFVKPNPRFVYYGFDEYKNYIYLRVLSTGNVSGYISKLNVSIYGKVPYILSGSQNTFYCSYADCPNAKWAEYYMKAGEPRCGAVGFVKVLLYQTDVTDGYLDVYDKIRLSCHP